MAETTIKIKLANNEIVAVDAQLQFLKSELFAPALENVEQYLLIKDHRHLNTIVHLTKLTPFVILQFDAQGKFSGATYSLDPNNSPFTFYSTASYFLLLHFPISFLLHEVLSIYNAKALTSSSVGLARMQRRS